MSDAVRWYDLHLAEVAAAYESISPDVVNAWFDDLLPNPPALILDVGAGTGRDAVWLASRGYEVAAVEPSKAMRAEAKRLHPLAPVRWISDSLPSLDYVFRSGLTFDVILISAVWMHVPPRDRARAFRKLINLLKPGGLMLLTLREGPEEPERGISQVSRGEVEQLAREHGAFIERSVTSTDYLLRTEVGWTNIAVRLPDDGTGALPLLRHIILNDDKSSTYKLALLRAICRIAGGAAGYASYERDENVSIPLGLVALFWIRLFRPLLNANLPQSPNNIGDSRLGFVREGFRTLDQVSYLDLRIGMIFSGSRAAALHAALRDACETITRMPAYHMRYPNGGVIMNAERVGRVPQPESIVLDKDYLSAFGRLLVPNHLWRALQRFDAWIEPAILSEWSRLMKVYATSQGRSLEDGAIAQAMTWSDPDRDVRLVREQALKIIAQNELYCVWTGKRLSASTLDIDHCFPWAVWPCDDLWNLLPTQRDVNQAQKRNRLPGDALLRSSQERIQLWWETAYLKSDDPPLGARFKTEARATLPSLGASEIELADVFASLNIQRLRLRHDHQVPLWEPNW